VRMGWGAGPSGCRLAVVAVTRPSESSENGSPRATTNSPNGGSGQPTWMSPRGLFRKGDLRQTRRSGARLKTTPPRRTHRMHSER
jgi:hypothetical protein